MAIDPSIPLQGRNVDIGQVIQTSLRTAALVGHLRARGQKREQVDMQNRAQAMKGALSITRDINNIYDATAQQELAPGTPGQEGMGMFSSPQAKATSEANRAYQERLPQLMASLGVDADGLEELGIPPVYDRERMKVLEQMFGQEDIKLQAATKPPPGYRRTEPDASGRPELEAIPGGPAELAQTKERRSHANKLSDDFTRDTKAAAEVSESFNGIVHSIALKSGPGDTAAIIQYAKMLDPGSVVRESEFGMVISAPGLSESVQNKINHWLGQGLLTDESRGQFLEAAQASYDSRMQGHDRVYGRYEERAKRAGLNPEDVLMDYRSGSTAKAKKLMEEFGKSQKTGMKGTGSGVIPAKLEGIPDLQWNAARKQYKDPATGKLYDAEGNEVAGG